MVSSVLARHAMASDKRLFRSNYAFFNQKSLTRFVGHYIALNEKVSSMPRLPAAAPKNPFKHSAAFDYHAEKRALDAQIQRLIHSIAETAAASTANPSNFPIHPEYPPLPPFKWRDANWGLIGTLVFSLLSWWAILNSAVPALASALKFVFNRSTL